MSKQDPYRFNLKFDETDEDHRKVCDFLNACGRKKARYIVRAVLSYWSMNGDNYSETNKGIDVGEEKQEDKAHMISVEDGDYSADQAEVSLMMKNYRMFDLLGEEL